MLSFLFWNIDNKPVGSTIASIAEEKNIDIIILAECDAVDRILVAINKSPNGYELAASPGCDKIKIFTRFSNKFVRPIVESANSTIREITLPEKEKFLMAATHLPSKIYWDSSSQVAKCYELSQEIRLAEKQAGHERTILVGDFNMNPFEDGMLSAAGLHAVMSRDIAIRGKRKIQSAEYSFFYNPMWSFFGDLSDGPPGTYFYQRAVDVVCFWNIFDQVLLRPELIPLFRKGDLEILSDGGETSLMRKGVPNRSKFSDHLPILFRLNL
jgi:exonuclease III